jgi:predicted ester cyclase
MSATSDQNKMTIVRFFEEVFNKGNMEVVDEILAPNYQYNGKPSPASGTKAWAESLRQKFPDLHFTIETILAENDQVALQWRMTATDPTTKMQVYATGINIIALADGKAITNVQGGGDQFFPVN